MTTSPKISFLKEYNLSHTFLILRGDGIIEIITSSDYTYDVQHIKEINEAIRILSGNRKIPILVVGGKYTLVTSEALDYMATKEASLFSLAEAYIVQSVAQRLLATFYLRVKKPVAPTRFFREQKEAEKWLYTFCN